MTDREKLIELIRKIKSKNGCCGDCSGCDEEHEEIVSAILADGWMRPPCKVGETVYVVMDIESVHRRILEMKVLSIEIGETSTVFAKTVKKYQYNYAKLAFEDFGKTVFLSREDAEKALNGVEG